MSRGEEGWPQTLALRFTLQGGGGEGEGGGGAWLRTWMDFIKFQVFFTHSIMHGFFFGFCMKYNAEFISISKKKSKVL